MLCHLVHVHVLAIFVRSAFTRRLGDAFEVRIEGRPNRAGVDVGLDDGCKPLESVPCSRIDLVVCNAGAFILDTLNTVEMTACRQQYEVNALGPLRTFQALRTKLAGGSKIMLIGSFLGSIGNNTTGSRVSALLELAPRRIMYQLSVWCIIHFWRW
jgi:NAD(P)-dependent dehydrogenase (short-subunit alcohol dehydrogenase family)